MVIVKYYLNGLYIYYHNRKLIASEEDAIKCRCVFKKLFAVKYILVAENAANKSKKKIEIDYFNENNYLILDPSVSFFVNQGYCKLGFMGFDDFQSQILKTHRNRISQYLNLNSNQ